jgi:hypothetical protein
MTCCFVPSPIAIGVSAQRACTRFTIGKALLFRKEILQRASVAVLATRCVVFDEDLLEDVASTRPNPGALHCPGRNSYGVVVIDDGGDACAGIMLAPSNQL